MALLFSFSHLVAGLEPDQTTHSQQVFLQGSSSEALQELVVSAGGSISHNLHVIDAVGALLTPQQLITVSESSKVHRVIDDLAVNPPPPLDGDENTEQTCQVGSAVELAIAKNNISWRLFNKEEGQVKLNKLSVSWPQHLGRISAVTLGDSAINIRDAQHSTGSLELALSEKEMVALKQDDELVIEFYLTDKPKTPLPAKQSDFSIEVHFFEGCSTALIPGYEYNYEDTYYPTAVGADALHRLGVTGTGVTVAVLDSGLWEHPNLAKDSDGNNRIIGRYDAIENRTKEEIFDASGHGTHMTSVIANSTPVSHPGVKDGSFKGIAPDVNLVVVKAFNIEGQGDLLDIVRAIQWVIENRERLNIKVLNLSFAARPRWSYWLDPINQATMRAWQSGITVVAAAGNEGPEAMTMGSPGNLPYIITVGAVTDSWTIDSRSDDYIPDFSSRGPTPAAHIKPDLVAPGGHMTGITRQGSTLTLEHPEYLLGNGEFVMTGTSQASALVSGVAALLLQLEPNLSPDDVKCKLTSSAELAINGDGLLAYSPFQQGNGYVSATRALTLGSTGCGNMGVNIDKDILGEEHYQGPATVDAKGATTLPGLENMLSPLPAAIGQSDTRTWGVKDHIERLDHMGHPASAPINSPFDWGEIYLQEKAAVETLTNPPSN